MWTNYTDSGKYVITINHKDVVQKNYKIKYQLNVNEKDIVYIVPRSAYVQDIAMNEQENFEIYLQEPGKVYLEIFECLGKVKV